MTTSQETTAPTPPAPVAGAVGWQRLVREQQEIIHRQQESITKLEGRLKQQQERIEQLEAERASAKETERETATERQSSERTYPIRVRISGRETCGFSKTQ